MKDFTDSEYLYEMAKTHENSPVPELRNHANRLTSIRHRLEDLERSKFNTGQFPAGKYLPAHKGVKSNNHVS